MKIKISLVSLVLLSIYWTNSYAQANGRISKMICELINEKNYNWSNGSLSSKIIPIATHRYRFEIKRDSILDESYELFSNGSSCYFDGEVIGYYSNPQAKRILTIYSKGEIDGKQISYYENGEIKKITNYELGIKAGEELEFYANGYPKSEGKYENGRKKGEWISHFPNKGQRTIGNYLPDFTEVISNNSKDSLFFINEQKDVLYTMEYQTGVDSLRLVLNIEKWWALPFPLQLFTKDGEWKYYNIEGALIRREYFKNGELVRIQPNE